jgi:crotonobetainyl-CoA:carnitine CoA-transferase CaiB-like acyl-CoA transferase
LRFSAFPEPLELDAPFLGEHNRQILSSYLGFSDERITQLETQQVLCSAQH